jgi:Putative lumazine-binding
VRYAALLVVAASLAAGCGEPEPSDEELVRETVTAFGRATADKDFQALCDRILAPKLIERVEQIGLPCEAALREGLGEVEDPRLTIGRITVRGEQATAEVRSSAAGQEPSRDTLQLTKVGEEWRIASLDGSG